MTRERIAIVGAGVAGLGAAFALRDVHDVVLFEADGRLGGHANTVDIDYLGAPMTVDTGFIVFNPVNYPNFTPFLEHLGVAVHATDMSFGFALKGRVEWCSDPRGLFARKRDLANPAHVRMLLDIVRFNKTALADLASGDVDDPTLGAYLLRRKFGERFARTYLLPMGAAIWSTSEDAMLEQPAQTVLRFFDNHRLLHMKRTPWSTVTGGSRVYVEKVAALLGDRVRLNARVTGAVRDPKGVTLTIAGHGQERFDQVIFASHSDQTLDLLTDASDDERAYLGAIGYAPNEVALHRDTRLMPRRRAAWASWNYLIDRPGAPAAVTYDMNRLQGLDPTRPLFVTLNPQVQPDPDKTFGRFQYAHPQFTTAAVAAQRRFNQVQGVRRTWFAGAWLGYGFHEDGLRSGLRVARRLGGQTPWEYVEGDVDGGAYAAPAHVAAQVAGLVAGQVAS